jgi:RHH-type proline utilization regulon transcriptional repressor/proline dehydrogenase/delta 1-pyrroline-5-carboxylate dehydrogenase
MVQFDSEGEEPGKLFDKILSRSGEPFIRVALKKAMRNLGEQYVVGQTIEEALFRSRRMDTEHYHFSYDMLGEAAICKADAERYYHAYLHAIDALAEFAKDLDDIYRAPSLSVKLSALHPRFEYSQRKRVLKELVDKVLHLATQARSVGVAITLDAEEADRLGKSGSFFSSSL